MNIELRSEILKYSLILEKEINNLLLLNLGIYDGNESKTRLFSNKGKLNFQNKIDLLYDIEILNKEENSNFGLLMIIRNKFLHDIECNSFDILFNQLDNGIKNRFKRFLEDGEKIENEEASKEACLKLFLKNIKTIRCKVKENSLKKEDRFNFFKLQNNLILSHIDIITCSMNDVGLILENSDLENKKVRKLSNQIINRLESTLQELSSLDTITDQLTDFFKSEEKMKNIFGITRSLEPMPIWKDFKSTSILDRDNGRKLKN